MAKPTIFIPGFPASELHDSNTGEKLFPPPLTNIGGALQKLVQVPGDVIAGPPIADKIPKIAPAASTLYKILGDYGISEANGNFIPIGWDWRLSVASDDTVARVKAAVDQLTPQGKIVAVIHSTGGLVLRGFGGPSPPRAGRVRPLPGRRGDEPFLLWQRAVDAAYRPHVARPGPPVHDAALRRCLPAVRYVRRSSGHEPLRLGWRHLGALRQRGRRTVVWCPRQRSRRRHGAVRLLVVAARRQGSLDVPAGRRIRRGTHSAVPRADLGAEGRSPDL